MHNDEASAIGTVDTCAILAIDRSTLSRWVKDGRIAPTLRLPGKTGAMIFDRATVEALRDELTAEAVPA